VLDPQLGRADLDLALVRVVEELRRPQDRVNHGADEREHERRPDRRCDEHRVAHPAPGVEERPRDEREVDDDQRQDKKVDDQIEGVVPDSE
jgi:hypothetical protein